MVMLVERVDAKELLAEVPRRHQSFTLSEIRDRLGKDFDVATGHGGTVLVRTQGLTLGLVQPGQVRSLAAAAALRDVEQDIASRRRHQGVVFLPWNTRLRPSREGAERLAARAITYQVAPLVGPVHEQPDILTSAKRFLNDWIDEGERDLEYAQELQLALHAHLAKVA